MGLVELIEKENWKLVTKTEKGKQAYYVKTPYEGELGLLKARHPVWLHLEIYAKHTSPDVKFQHMKIAHDMLWPGEIWHDWTERRFKAHCGIGAPSPQGYNFISQAAGASAAKAQPLSAKIRVPWGWTTMGELKIGSVLCDTSGGLQTVTAIHPQGIKDIYEVSFSDGSKTEATADHLWEVQSKKDRDRYRSAKLRTTLEIKEQLKYHYSIPSHAALFGNSDVPLPVDPWLLGYFIGNGCLAKKVSATITCPTKQLADKIKALWPDCTVKKYKDRNCYLILLRGLRTLLSRIPELAFKKSINKSIPPAYLYGNISTRTAVFQGLIDSDGTKPRNEKSGISISFSNKLLRDQTAELSRSLGYFTSVSGAKKTHYLKNGKSINCHDSYSCYISKKNRHRVITSVILKRKDYAQCITVSSPNHSYITDDCIVTHNSFDWAKIAVLFFFANPLERNVTIASTTLASLKGRVWGYVTRFVQTMAIQPKYNYKSSPNPQILPIVPEHMLKATGRGKITDNTLHGMFAVTARLGDDDQAVASWIGKHPTDKILVILDEGTDMPMSIINTFPNLNSHPEKFQLCIIGNSKSTQDLHGCLSTPENGWDSISVDLDEWKTVQMNGICQYFNPYRSPALTHPDPAMRKIYSVFLRSEENLKQAEAEYGVDSENFYRMVLGFWKSRSSEATTVSDKFLKDFSPRKPIHWSGYYPIQRVAGFDFAISTDGDNPILRIANVGQDIDGGVKIDFGFLTSIFKLELKAIADKSFERQIAIQVVDILIRYGIKITNLAVDVTGQGRAIAECICYENEKRNYPLGIGYPLKVYSMSQHNKNKRKESAPDLLPISTHELYNDFRAYIEKDSIRGLDETVIYQLVNRQIVRKGDRSFLESKKDYKRRMSALGNAHSPDEADASALVIQAVKLRLGIMPGLKWKNPAREEAQGYLDKVFAMSRGSNTIAKKPIGLPKPNFSSGLEKYARHRR